jgi:hypothetical protein
MKVCTALALASILALAGLVNAPPAAAAASCGLKPLKPLRPLGCRGELVAHCVCDSRGANCSWQWVCGG